MCGPWQRTVASVALLAWECRWFERLRTAKDDISQECSVIVLSVTYAADPANNAWFSATSINTSPLLVPPSVFYYHCECLPSVLWHYCLDVRKSIRPVKNWCWLGYLSEARCKWSAHGPADATATLSSLTSLKSRLVQPFWCQLTQVVPEKRSLKGYLSVCLSVYSMVHFEFNGFQLN